MIQQLKDLGIPWSYIQVLVDTKTKDKNAFAEGLLGTEQYKELNLKSIDLNELTKLR